MKSTKLQHKQAEVVHNKCVYKNGDDGKFKICVCVVWQVFHLVTEL